MLFFCVGWERSYQNLIEGESRTTPISLDKKTGNSILKTLQKYPEKASDCTKIWKPILSAFRKLHFGTWWNSVFYLSCLHFSFSHNFINSLRVSYNAFLSYSPTASLLNSQIHPPPSNLSTLCVLLFKKKKSPLGHFNNKSSSDLHIRLHSIL